MHGCCCRNLAYLPCCECMGGPPRALPVCMFRLTLRRVPHFLIAAACRISSFLQVTPEKKIIDDVKSADQWDKEAGLVAR